MAPADAWSREQISGPLPCWAQAETEYTRAQPWTHSLAPPVGVPPAPDERSPGRLSVWGRGLDGPFANGAEG